MSDVEHPPSSREEGRADRWSSGGGARGVRLWSLIIVLILLGLIVVAFLNLSPIANKHAPSTKATTTAGQMRPPQHLNASGDISGVLLSWQPAQPAPIGYRIYRAMGPHQPYTIVGAVTSPDMDTFTDDSDLTPGATYSYTVTSFDRSGESAPAGPIAATALTVHKEASTAEPTPVPFQPSTPAVAIATSQRAVTVPLATPTLIATVPTLPAMLPTSAVSSPAPQPTPPPGTFASSLPSPVANVPTPILPVSTVTAVAVTPQSTPKP